MVVGTPLESCFSMQDILILALHRTLIWFTIIYEIARMQLSTIIAILGAAIASSRTVGVPESGEDVQDIDIAEGFGDRIPGQNPVSFCKGDRSHDGVCREPLPVSVARPLPQQILVPLRDVSFELREINLTN